MAGQPPKISKELIEAFKQVVDDNVLACTDEEIFFLMNDRLPREKQICYASFKNYKNNPESYVENHPELKQLFDEYLAVIKKALIKEKNNLLKELKTDKQAWQRWAWIIERKFDEWNIRQKFEGDVNVREKVGELFPPLDEIKEYARESDKP